MPDAHQLGLFAAEGQKMLLLLSHLTFVFEFLLPPPLPTVYRLPVQSVCGGAYNFIFPHTIELIAL